MSRVVIALPIVCLPVFLRAIVRKCEGDRAPPHLLPAQSVRILPITTSVPLAHYLGQVGGISGRRDHRGVVNDARILCQCLQAQQREEDGRNMNGLLECFWLVRRVVGWRREWALMLDAAITCCAGCGGWVWAAMRP